MADDWETVEVTFEDVPANPQICISITNKRCFIDALTITTPVEPETEIDIIMDSDLATFCSTKDLDFTNVEGLKAYIATGYSHGNITLTRVNNVPAGTGLVLVGEPGTYTVFIGDGQVVLSNMLVGTTKDITLSATVGSKTNFILTSGSDGTFGFYPTTGGTLVAGKAYLPLPTSLVDVAGVKNFGIQLEDGEDLFSDTKDIYDLSIYDLRFGNSGWYTLDGRRLQHRPHQPGIYVRDGRKVVVR